MKNLYGWIITIFIVLIAQTSIAEVDSLRPDNKTNTLDLTSKEGAAVDLLECGIYVLEEGGNSYLVHSKGKLPIPKAAVHIWPDEATAEIETTGALMGLKLVSMMLANFKSTDKRPVPYQFVDAPSNANRNIDRNFPAEEWVISDSGIHFFIAEKESRIAKTIKNKLPTARVIPTSELENGREVILLNPAYLHPVGGFPLSEYLFNENLSNQFLIQVDYNCGVRQDPRNNPYFKKQNEIFRFGQ